MYGPSGAWRGRLLRWSCAEGESRRRRLCWPRRWTRSRRPAMAAASPRPSKPPLGRLRARRLPVSGAVARRGGSAARAAPAAPLPDEDRGAHHALSQQVRRALGPEEADRARSSGRRLPNAQVGAIARRVLRASQLAQRAAGGPPHRLGVHQPADRPGAGHRREDHRGSRAPHHRQARRPESQRGRGVGWRAGHRPSRARLDARMTERRRGLHGSPDTARAAAALDLILAIDRWPVGGSSHDGNDGDDDNDDIRRRGQAARGLYVQHVVPVLGGGGSRRRRHL